MNSIQECIDCKSVNMYDLHYTGKTYCSDCGMRYKSVGCTVIDPTGKNYSVFEVKLLPDYYMDLHAIL